MKNCVTVPTQPPFSDLEATDYISDDMVQQGDPQEMGKSVYTSECGKFDVGVWQCDNNVHQMSDCPYDEFVYLIEGELEITHEDGRSTTYQAGESFVMPKGTNCVWNVRKPIKKIYVVLE